MLSFIMSQNGYRLWSWGNYRYSIDKGMVEVQVLPDTDFEDAVEIFKKVAKSS